MKRRDFLKQASLVALGIKADGKKEIIAMILDKGPVTAEELLRFYARIFGIPRSEADRRIEQLLALVELESKS
jgi:ABC-type multidrug transport system ATPase subunit